MGGLQLCLLSPLADLHEKEWSIQYSNGEHDDPESLDLLLYACYAGNCTYLMARKGSDSGPSLAAFMT